jgi:hypothetical protein
MSRSTLWRTLVRIESFDEATEMFHVFVPGWSSTIEVLLDIEEVPDNIQRRYFDDKHIRFHAMVNIGCDEADELVFDDWEES